MDPLFIIGADSAVQHTPAITQGYLPRGPRRSYDKVRYHPAPGNFSSLPRTSSQESVGSRGSKPYSSARYPSSTSIKPHQTAGTLERKRSSLSRNSSFQGAVDQHIIVSPLDQNPAVLSEETEDDSYLFRKASSSSNPQYGINYENVTRRTSDESVRSYSSAGGGPNYQNVSGSSGTGKSVSLPRRTHEVILEDPFAPQPMESKIEDFHSTFPRRIPSRTQSMHIHANAAPPPKVPPHQTGSADWDWMQPREKGLCLRRGASLHGTADLSTRNNTSSASVGAQYPRATRRGSTSTGGNEAASGGEFVLPSVRQHRRAQSLEAGQNQGAAARGVVVESADSAERRVVSEYYPPGREDYPPGREDAGGDGTGSEGEVLEEPRNATANLGAQAMGFDSNQQVGNRNSLT